MRGPSTKSRAAGAMTGLVAALVIAGNAAAAGNPEARYCGTMTSAGTSTEHVTILRVRPDKRLAGEYVFADGGKEETGTLREEPDGDDNPLTATLRWQDAYGTGLLVITFDSDYRSFEGKWGSGDEAPANMWFGDPCEK